MGKMAVVKCGGWVYGEVGLAGGLVPTSLLMMYIDVGRGCG